MSLDITGGTMNDAPVDQLGKIADDERADRDVAQNPQATLVGRTSVTMNEPSTINEFPFWIQGSQQIEAMDYVSVQRTDTNPASTTVGVVTRIEHRTDAKDHLDNWAASNFGNAATPLSSSRLSATVGYAKVMHNSAEQYMPIRGDLETFLSQADEIQSALGVGNIPTEEQICFGLINQSSNANTQAIGDIRYVIGGEGAHVSISGISGLATKSSYAMFLVEQIHRHLNYGSKTAIIVVNVKKDDLLHIHESRRIPTTTQGQQLIAASNKIRSLLGLPDSPYEPSKVHYLLPLSPLGGPNVYAEPARSTGLPPYRLYAYDVSDLPRILPFLFSRILSEGDWDSGEALLYDLGEEISPALSKQTLTLSGNPQQPGNIYYMIAQMTGRGKLHAESTGKKFNKHWKRLIGTGAQGVNTGLLVDRRTGSAISLRSELEQMQAGHIYVIDIARLNGDEQQMVFGDIMSAADECISSKSSQANKPEKVVVVFDELNKYAPANNRNRTNLTERILDVAERGRSFGLSLIGAAQFNSAVHARVVGNASTHIMGRTESGELSDSMYRHIEPDMKTLISRLDKGEMIVKHPIYRQLVRVRFPLPAFHQPGS